MKFDYVIGNPPYQEESKGEVSKLNGQKPRKNVFQKFQLAVDDITECTSVLIYPAVRWIHRSGKGCEDFGLQQINDTHLSQIVYYEDAKEIFPNVAIPDGVSIVVKNQDKTEAENFYKYVKSYVVRFAFLMTDEALTSLGKAVPDLQDYTNKNKIIDFKQDIDGQLKTKMDLKKEELAYIIDRVNSIRKEKE